MAKRKLYTNFKAHDYAINFFMLNARGTRAAQLACPFFTTAEPLELLHREGCSDLRLIVRLCSATTPSALHAARALRGTTIRYFTSQAFHAKFYILNKVAMLGSANLTDAGLKSNREIAIVLGSDDEVFDELPSLFDDLWDVASTLTDDVLAKFERWYRSPANQMPQHSIDGIEDCSPPTVDITTRTKSRERTYLESFRRAYTESLIPAHREVEAIYHSVGTRHPSFKSLPIEYEIDRFLNWAKLTFTTDETLFSFPVRQETDRKENVRQHVDKWLATKIQIDAERTARLERLKQIFSTPNQFKNTSYDDLTNALLGCAAFDEQLRFNKGGEDALVQVFKKDNRFEAVSRSFTHLIFGREEYVQRIYDCIFGKEYKLDHFGRSCVLELYGWVNNSRIPPLNGRTLKALRYLGFDVSI